MWLLGSFTGQRAADADFYICYTKKSIPCFVCFCVLFLKPPGFGQQWGNFCRSYVAFSCTQCPDALQIHPESTLRLILSRPLNRAVVFVAAARLNALNSRLSLDLCKAACQIGPSARVLRQSTKLVWWRRPPRPVRPAALAVSLYQSECDVWFVAAAALTGLPVHLLLPALSIHSVYSYTARLLEPVISPARGCAIAAFTNEQGCTFMSSLPRNFILALSSAFSSS